MSIYNLIKFDKNNGNEFRILHKDLFWSIYFYTTIILTFALLIYFGYRQNMKLLLLIGLMLMMVVVLMRKHMRHKLYMEYRHILTNVKEWNDDTKEFALKEILKSELKLKGCLSLEYLQFVIPLIKEKANEAKKEVQTEKLPYWGASLTIFTGYIISLVGINNKELSENDKYKIIVVSISLLFSIGVLVFLYKTIASDVINAENKRLKNLYYRLKDIELEFVSKKLI